MCRPRASCWTTRCPTVPHTEKTAAAQVRSQQVPAGQQAVISEGCETATLQWEDNPAFLCLPGRLSPGPCHLAVAGLLSLCALCFSLLVLISQSSKSLVRTETSSPVTPLGQHFFLAPFIHLAPDEVSKLSCFLPLQGWFQGKASVPWSPRGIWENKQEIKLKSESLGFAPPHAFVFWPLPCVWLPQLVRENNSWQQSFLQKSPSSYASS